MTTLLKIATVLMLMTSHQVSTIQNNESSNLIDLEINIKNLSKKWNLDQYKISFYSESPSEKEKNDYMHLRSDLTFDSISEGEFDSGIWRLDAQKKRIYLSKKNESGELIFIIDELRSEKLVLTLDDPSDSDSKYLKIHFIL